MALDRIGMLSYLEENYAEICTDLHWEKADSGPLKAVLDSALAEFGVNYASLATATVVDGSAYLFQKLLDYFFLERALRGKVPAVSLKTDRPQPSAERQQAFDHLLKLLERAKRECQAAGYLLDDDTLDRQLGFAELELDMVEPLSA